MPVSNNRSIVIPGVDGALATYQVRESIAYQPPASPFTARRCYAATHVVVDPLADYTPGVRPPVDWEATDAFRRHVWRYGIGIAEAMDTSERGHGGLGWPQTQELIRHSVKTANEVGGALVCGVGTDQLSSGATSISAVKEAYLEQLEFVESLGTAGVIRASHELVKVAKTPEDYADVYGAVFAAAKRPLIVHWIGGVFNPIWANYWGESSPDAAMNVAIEIARDNRDKLDGFKFSLLDLEREQEFRRQLPEGVVVYTGDDHHYPELMLGDDSGYSHAFLGAFDPLAPAASAAMQKLERGDRERFFEQMKSTRPLALRMFEDPAGSYKTGVVFLAYIAGYQDHFRMVTGNEGMRSIRHLVDLFVMADKLGLFPDPELAVRRMRMILALSGIG